MMFVQVIRGPVGSAGEVQGLFDRWMAEVRPGAIGWLGQTAGTTPDGELVVLARFSSAEEARRNSDRPEQGAWWAEMEKVFTGPVEFHDCSDVALMLGGGDDAAGFVQVMESRPVAPLTAQEVAELGGDAVRQHRPDVLGGVIAIAEDGTTFQAIYFTSEGDAREYEAREMPPEVQAELAETMSQLGEMTFYDLTTPILVSA